MLAAPKTCTPCDSAHRISLCQTGSDVLEHAVDQGDRARGATDARSTSPTAAGGSTVQSSRARISARRNRRAGEHDDAHRRRRAASARGPGA